RARNLTEPAGHDRDVVRTLVLEDAQLGLGIALERPMAIEVIRLEVQENGDPGPQRLDVLELEGRQLAHDPALGRHLAGERGQRAADVPGNLDGSARGAK